MPMHISTTNSTSRYWFVPSSSRVCSTCALRKKEGNTQKIISKSFVGVKIFLCLRGTNCSSHFPVYEVYSSCPVSNLLIPRVCIVDVQMKSCYFHKICLFVCLFVCLFKGFNVTFNNI